MAVSAFGEVFATVIETQVTGREVPIVTNVMAVTVSLKPPKESKYVAKFFTMAVVIPMNT